MTKPVYKYEMERLLLYTYPDLWKKLLPKNTGEKLEFWLNENDHLLVRRWVEYDTALNPFNHLKMADDIASSGYMTRNTFFSIKKKCIDAYWRNWQNSKEWVQWYSTYLYNKEKEEARSQWREMFVAEYVNEQKEALAEGCSKLVFKDGKQIPEEVENIIQEFVGH